jgi:hypothetical protein
VVEHFLDTEGVRGSNPLSRTIFLNWSDGAISPILDPLVPESFWRQECPRPSKEEPKLAFRLLHCLDSSNSSKDCSSPVMFVPVMVPVPTVVAMVQVTVSVPGWPVAMIDRWRTHHDRRWRSANGRRYNTWRWLSDNHSWQRWKRDGDPEVQANPGG